MTSSVYNKYSRYVHGGRTEVGATGLEWWDRRPINVDPNIDELYQIEKTTEGRVDLISSRYYGTPKYWWVICQANNILDPHSELLEGEFIYMIHPSRIEHVLSGKQGGFSSKRKYLAQSTSIIV